MPDIYWLIAAQRRFLEAMDTTLKPPELVLKLRFLNLAPKGQRHASPGRRPGNWIGY